MKGGNMNLNKRIEKLEKELEELKLQVKKEETFETCNDLMWSNSIGKDLTWNESQEFAKKCRDGGFDDWRLPTVSELQNVFDYEKGKSKIAGWDFEAGYNYWSGTTYSNSTQYAWYVYQYNGSTTTNGKISTTSVRCVR